MTLPGPGLAPYYQDDYATIYHGDCREILPQLWPIGCVVTDPPYGLGEHWTGGTWFTRGVYAADRCEWDAEAPHDVVAQLVALGVPVAVWGGNHFRLPLSRCWLVWNKTNSVPTMADCELAWTNLDRPALAFEHPCNGWARAHPTEKPLALMQWCLSFLPGAPVLDPFMGAGTTLVAAKNLGRRSIGIEIEERYCDIAAKRLSQEVLEL